jgi:hypothetical protein
MPGICTTFGAAYGQEGCPAYPNLVTAFSTIVSTSARIVRQQIRRPIALEEPHADRKASAPAGPAASPMRYRIIS